MRRHSGFSTLLILSSLVACSAPVAHTATQEADHTEGEPTYAQYAWLWADESEEEFKQIAAATSTWLVPTFLPVDSAVTKRLQFWVDAMDDALRAAHPEAMAATPKPRVIIRKDDDPNAWVSYIPVAWRVPTRLASAAEQEGSPDEKGTADGDGNAGAAATGASELTVANNGQIIPAFAPPIERDHDETQLAEFIQFHNEGFAKCRLSLEGGAVVLGNECETSHLPGDRADRLAYHATGKWITVTTGLLTEILDEDRIVAILAHELGHYYRSHSAQPTDVVNYFYALGDGNYAHKPPPDPRFAEETAAVREKLRSAGWFTSFEEENRLMTEHRLGFYTDEQEADELGLELLAMIGLPPTLASDAILQFQKISETYMPPWRDSGEIGWAECSMLRDRGFRDEEGQFVSVPVGDPSNAHHSYCFRVFNMTRELLAHDYTLAASRPRPPGGSWAGLLSRLDEEPPADPSPSAQEEGEGDADAGT